MEIHLPAACIGSKPRHAKLQFTFKNGRTAGLASSILASRRFRRRGVVIKKFSAGWQLVSKRRQVIASLVSRLMDDDATLVQQRIVRLHASNAPLLVFGAEIVKLFHVVFLPYFKHNFDALGRPIIGLLVHLLDDIFDRTVARQAFGPGLLARLIRYTTGAAFMAAWLFTTRSTQSRENVLASEYLGQWQSSCKTDKPRTLY